MGKISLALGAITEQVSVTAAATPTQTASSENSKLIDNDQLKRISLKGRDLFCLMITMPGVNVSARDTTSENTIGSVRINGATNSSANFTVDGVTNLDTGSNGTSHFEPNIDAIAEMRVLTSNYQAEYGRNSNGVISVVTKGGSQEFHGSAWANKRHEMFNAKTTTTNPQMNWTGGYEAARMLVVGDPQLPKGQVSFAGNTPLVQAAGSNVNGTPGNQLLNENVFVIPNPCSWTPGPTPQQGIGQSTSCFGNAGAGSLIPLPNTRMFNWDMTFGKAFPLRSEKRQLIFRAEMYNIFNHTQFTAANIGPQYSRPNWQQGILVQTNANVGRYTAAANPRQMSMSLRLQF